MLTTALILCAANAVWCAYKLLFADDAAAERLMDIALIGACSVATYGVWIAM